MGQVGRLISQPMIRSQDKQGVLFSYLVVDKVYEVCEFLIQPQHGILHFNWIWAKVFPDVFIGREPDGKIISIVILSEFLIDNYCRCKIPRENIPIRSIFQYPEIPLVPFRLADLFKVIGKNGPSLNPGFKFTGIGGALCILSQWQQGFPDPVKIRFSQAFFIELPDPSRQWVHVIAAAYPMAAQVIIPECIIGGMSSR